MQQNALAEFHPFLPVYIPPKEPKPSQHRLFHTFRLPWPPEQAKIVRLISIWWIWFYLKWPAMQNCWTVSLFSLIQFSSTLLLLYKHEQWKDLIQKRKKKIKYQYNLNVISNNSLQQLVFRKCWVLIVGVRESKVRVQYRTRKKVVLKPGSSGFETHEFSSWWQKCLCFWFYASSLNFILKGIFKYDLPCIFHKLFILVCILF